MTACSPDGKWQDLDLSGVAPVAPHRAAGDTQHSDGLGAEGGKSENRAQQGRNCPHLRSGQREAHGTEPVIDVSASLIVRKVA